MKLIVFPQYAKLVSFFRAIASACAADTARWTICRVEPRNGVAHLRDRSMNLLALSGGETRIVLPDIIPGKTRQFCLRLSATGENAISFDGASLGILQGLTPTRRLYMWNCLDSRESIGWFAFERV